MGELVVKEEEEKDKFEVKRGYYETGAVKIVGTYKKGVPEGVFRKYDEQGNIDSAKVYSGGRLLRQGKMDNQGREQGEWKSLREVESCARSATTSTASGKVRGSSASRTIRSSRPAPCERETERSPGNGTTRTDNCAGEETYANGKENGYMTEYSGQRHRDRRRQLRERLAGWRLEIPQRRYLAEGKFTEGKEDGRWKQTYPNGKLAFEGEYLDGQETGVHKYYWPNGKEREERTYRLGLLDGVWKVFRRRRRADRDDDLPQRRRDQDRAGRVARASWAIDQPRSIPGFFRSSFTISFSFGFFTTAAFQLFRQRHAEAERNRFLSSFAVTADDSRRRDSP